jgi:hypothetical protein
MIVELTRDLTRSGNALCDEEALEQTVLQENNVTSLSYR